MYPFFTLIFFASILICLLLISGWFIQPRIWRSHSRKIIIFCMIWFTSYAIFIAFFTGPEDLTKYPPQQSSPFKLPWAGRVTRFVAQGNRSFTSHRGRHLYAWDFLMPIGTPVLAAGEGQVVLVEMNHAGIGLHGNLIFIQHPSGITTGYAHLKMNSAFVKVGDHVAQGQMIALSGLTGQTPFPHLHFFALDQAGQIPTPISFRDVPGGVPFAGHFYTSDNVEAVGR